MLWMVALMLRARWLQFEFQGRSGHSFLALAGIDMGNGANVFLFCLAMDMAHIQARSKKKESWQKANFKFQFARANPLEEGG